MNRFINAKLAALKPYSFEEGACDVRLDANESFISLPDRLRDRLADIARNLEYNRYPDPLATRCCRAFGKNINVDGRYITAGNGSDELINIIVNAFLLKGERLLVFNPDFSMYGFYAYIAEAECVAAVKPSSMTLDKTFVDTEIERCAPKMVMLSNPCSPTGAGLSREDICVVVKSHPEALFVIDEAYMDFWDQSVLPKALDMENMIILKTCSKALGIAALRLGFAIANAELTDCIRKSKSPVNVNSFTQAAACAVLEDTEYIQEAANKLRDSAQELYGMLKKLEQQNSGRIQVYPTVANFLFVQADDAEVLQKALKDEGILVRCISGHLRITAGNPAENKAIAGALKIILNNTGGGKNGEAE